MVKINISIPDELHRELKIKCAIENKTLKDHIIDVLDKEISKGMKKVKK